MSLWSTIAKKRLEKSIRKGRLEVVFPNGKTAVFGQHCDHPVRIAERAAMMAAVTDGHSSFLAVSHIPTAILSAFALALAAFLSSLVGFLSSILLYLYLALLCFTHSSS